MQPVMTVPQTQVRLADVLFAFAAATDLGMGQPLGSALRSCWLSMRLARTVRLQDHEHRQVYALSLLHYLGCTTNGQDLAALFGSDIQMMRGFLAHHMGVLPKQLELQLPSTPALPNEDAALESNRSSCEVASRLAATFGLGLEVQSGLWQLFEHWDGSGLPQHLRGDAIALPVRIVQIARDFETFWRFVGLEPALEVLTRRAGSGLDPALVEVFVEHAPAWIIELEGITTLRAEVLSAEPSPHTILNEERFEAAIKALSDFSAIKSATLRGHARGVAELAIEAARLLGLEAPRAALLGRVALLQDVGNTGISAGILSKTAALTEAEWEQIRLHPYHSERVLKSSKALESMGELAAMHHERLDGSGYHRGITAASLPFEARVLAVADAHYAMSQPRAHRGPLASIEIKRVLLEACRVGRLDAEAVHAVLRAAGDGVAHARIQTPAGLSPRELEVLRHLALGASNRAIAQRLGIRPKTIGHHVQHIFEKLNVNTRAGATLFAMQNHLL
jgi:HD-GYP domain-containing protein (c-di-GMP phosphodiesterase class II)